MTRGPFLRAAAPGGGGGYAHVRGMDQQPLARDAVEGKGPQRRLDRRLEEVAKAVGGSYCRLPMPLKLGLAVRETVAGHWLGALEGEGGTSAPPSNASLRPYAGHKALHTCTSWYACAAMFGSSNEINAMIHQILPHNCLRGVGGGTPECWPWPAAASAL